MERQPNFLEADSSILEKSLMIVRDDLQENLEKCFKAATDDSVKVPPRDFKIITPTPGFCIKSFKVNTNEKYFINVCQAADIPPPEDITEEELTEILKSSEPSNFRIPMSISEQRITRDKSQNPVDVCDVAINPQFFVKCQKSSLFKEFFMVLISEALSEKYNVQLAQDKTIILNGRKCIGTLVKHRVRNNDIKSVLTTYKNPTAADIKKIEEIETLESDSKPSHHVALVEEVSAKIATVPEYNVLGKLNDKKSVEEILAEFYLPKCVSANEVAVRIGEDRIVVESVKQGYMFEKFVDLKLKPNGAKAHFEQKQKMLSVSIPVLI